MRESAGGLIRFTIAAGNAYFEAMPSKPLDLPMKVAKSFMKDMRAFHAEKNAIKREKIAPRPFGGSIFVDSRGDYFSTC